MERQFYSVYNAIQYSSEELGDFFAVKNLINTANNEIIYIERVLYDYGLIQSQDIDRYCFVPGSSAIVQSPNILCFTDFYLTDKRTLEIIGKVITYPAPNNGLNDFIILCDTDYAKTHGWLDT